MSSSGPASPRLSPVAAQVHAEAGVRVLAAAAAASGVSVASLLAQDRRPVIVRPRHAAMLALRNLGMSLPAIARRVQRDSSTVLHGVRAARALVANEPAFAALVAEVQARAGQCPPPAEQI